MLEESVHVLDKAGRSAGLKINVRKTKTMTFGSEECRNEIAIENGKVENVNEFTYLGSLLTWDNDCTKDMKARIAKGKKKTDRDKILVFEMYCYRWVLHIGWMQKVTNREIRKRLGVKEDLF